MPKLKIYKFPDAVLKEKAAPVSRVEKDFYRLADDMLETMYEAPGIGLAANQVGILKQIIVIDTEYDIDEESVKESGVFPEGTEEGAKKSTGIIRNKDPKILLNPKITYREGKILYCEGCLSVPEYTAEVERSEKIKIEYLDITGLTKTLTAEGLMAVCLQHELDHLNGKLFIDRLSPLKSEMVKKKLVKARAEEEE